MNELTQQTDLLLKALEQLHQDNWQICMVLYCAQIIMLICTVIIAFTIGKTKR